MDSDTLTRNTPCLEQNDTPNDYISEMILNFVNNVNESRDDIDNFEDIHEVDKNFKEFMETSPNFLTFENICRLCLSSYSNEEELKKVFDDNLPISDMIHSFTSIKLLPDDDFPKHVCDTCVLQLKKCIAFKNQVESVDIILHQFINEQMQVSSSKNGTEFLKCCFEQCEKDIQIPIEIYTFEDQFEIGLNQNEDVDTLTNEKLEICKMSLAESCENYYDVIPSQESGETLYPEIANNLEEEYSLKSLLRPMPKKEKPFRCTLCPRRFTNESILNDHMDCHDNRRKQQNKKTEIDSFVCTTCNDVFSVQQDLEIHKSLHTTNTKKGISFECNSCKKNFADLKRLKRHISTHFVDKPYKCKECNRGFSEMASLTRHYRRHTHNKRERKFACSECDKCYSNSYDLKIHQRTHSGEKPWVCKDCGKCFTDCRLLNSHRKIHATTKAYACEECGKQFTHYSNLQTHIRIHSGHKPYTCYVCSKSFTQSSNMVLHMRIHTKERPYKCVECPKSFASSSNLSGHLKWHNFSAMRKQKSRVR